jgi:DNA-binding NarL/FixJ family response regulator
MEFLVVEDDWLARGGIVKTLESLRPDSSIVAVSTLAEAFEALLQTPGTDLVILDLNLGATSGVETLVNFRAWCEERQIEPRVVVLSGAATDDPSLVADVLANHGTGFILKGTSEEMFKHALGLTLAGGVFMPQEALRALAPRNPARPNDANGVGQPHNLTKKESEVAALLIQGLTYKRIAQVLTKRHSQAISENTVRVHVGNIAWKLGVTENVKAGVMAEIAKRGLKFSPESILQG